MLIVFVDDRFKAAVIGEQYRFIRILFEGIGNKFKGAFVVFFLEEGFDFIQIMRGVFKILDMLLFQHRRNHLMLFIDEFPELFL